MHYFFCDKIHPADQTLRIDGPDARHIQHVLRLKPGDRIGLFDGRGMKYTAAIDAVLPKGVRVRVIAAQQSGGESPVAITVAQAILKDRKMDRIVRQLTELGVCAWLIFSARRSVPKPDPRKLAARGERWKRITREAVKQCHRGRVMEILPSVTFNEMLLEAKPYDLRVVFYENEPASPTAKTGLPPAGTIRRIFAVIGPEGGFADNEIEAARAAGFVTAGLGPRILRADTAAVAAAALLQFLYGDLGEKDLDKSAAIE